MRNINSIKRDETFFSLEESKQMNILGINEETFKTPRFKGVNRKTVISDLWNGKTNSEQRNLMKAI